MLSWGCRRFRAQFSPGEPVSSGLRRHRGECADCAYYAQALERTAAVRLPLPESLRAELSSLPTAAVGGLLPGGLPVPALPLPAALRFRLQGIARAGAPAGARSPRKPPVWITSPRYAIAASLLLTTLTAALLGSPVDLGVRAAGFLDRQMAPPLLKAGETGEEKIRAFHATAASRYGALRGGLDASVRGLQSRFSTLTHSAPIVKLAHFTDLAGRLLPASQNENRGGSEAPNRERRKP
jgi:hypothetical protein